MKRIGIIIALLLSMLMVTPAMAAGSTDTQVTLSPITVDGQLVTGSPITVSGTVQVTATATTRHEDRSAYAYGDAFYSVVDPSGNNLSGITNNFKTTISEMNPADASEVFAWSYKFTTSIPGIYDAVHGGYAYAWERNPNHSSSDYQWGETWFTVVAAPVSELTGLSVTSDMINPLAITDKPGRFYGFIENKAAWVDWSTLSVYSGNTSAELNATGELNGKQYKITVPAGTMITGATPTSQSNYIQVRAWQGDEVVWSPTTINFSNPVTFSKLVNGTWVAQTIFSKLVGGEPQ